MADQTLSISGSSEVAHATAAAPQATDAAVIVIDSDDEDGNDLSQSLKRARKEWSISRTSVASSPSVASSTMPSLFTREACEVLRRRPKKESPAPEQPPDSSNEASQPQGDAAPEDASSQSNTVSTVDSTTISLFGHPTTKESSALRSIEEPSHNEPLEPHSTSNTAHKPTDQPKEKHNEELLERKRPHQASIPNSDPSQTTTRNKHKKARSAKPGTSVLHNTQTIPALRPTMGSKTTRQAQDKKDNISPPPSKIRAPVASAFQDDVSLFRQLEKLHRGPAPIRFPNSPPYFAGLDLERVRKSTEYAPSKQEQRKAHYRGTARTKRAGDIRDNIVQNARRQYPDMNEAAIQREAEARVGAWRRGREAEDKVERQLNLDGLKAQQRRAVTNLSSATAVDLLGQNRVVIVFTVFQSAPFDEGEGKKDDGTPWEGNVVRLDSFIDMKKANDLATKQIYGGLTVNSAQRKEVILTFDDERDGLVYGSARLPDGKKFICFVKKENKQVGQLDPRLFEGKKVREDALKHYRLRFDVFSTQVRPARDGEEGSILMGSSAQKPQEQRDAREVTVESERSTGTVAVATFPEGSVNPAGLCVYDHEIHGSYVDRVSAHSKAFEVMRDLWRPTKPRLGAVIYYRDKVKPWIDGAEEQGSWDIHNVQLTFNPNLHDSPYEFLSSTVQVAQTELKGAIELGDILEDGNNETGTARPLL